MASGTYQLQSEVRLGRCEYNTKRNGEEVGKERMLFIRRRICDWEISAPPPAED